MALGGTAHTPALERVATVQLRTGLSRTEIYRQVKAGTFPAPVKIGSRSSAWIASEVDSWIEARIAARDSDRSGCRSAGR
ncbi:AlpA family transcriptional regulator [Lysobacter sp. GX 14042]|uniref:helix-turn-helix transcriptional regulator n=1 Tax=Lysobacter sp. GX 14042 TaxID=2907155 RepID=UPI001F15BE28|nr:AlpA family transcriptional regulator [Lysobacter sp. GX 14042]MCE7031732.1 AlpA family transcriptional regulator [Lysobacter sp. GX 14042]